MEKPDPKQKTVWLIDAAIICAIIACFFMLPLGGVFSFVGLLAIAILVFIIFVILFLISYVAIDYYYRAYMYELAGDRILIKKGIIIKKSVSIPYGRIQNVDIVRGPIQRIFGVATLRFETAGASGQYARTEGVIPGIVNPEEISERVMKKVIGIKKDREGIGAPAQKEGDELLSEILSEIKGLRKDLKK